MTDNYNGGGTDTARPSPPDREIPASQDYTNGRHHNKDRSASKDDMNGQNNRQRGRSSRSLSPPSRRSRGHHSRSRSRSGSLPRSPHHKNRHRRERHRSRSPSKSRSRSRSRSRDKHRRSQRRRSKSRSRSRSYSPGGYRGGRRHGGRSRSPNKEFSKSRSRSKDRNTTRRSRSPRHRPPHNRGGRSFSRDRSRSAGRHNFGHQPFGMGPADDDYYRRGPPMMQRGEPAPHGYPDRNPYGVNYGPYGGGGGFSGYAPPPPQAQAPGGGGGRRRGRRGGQDGVSLLVRNLSTDITTDDLKQAFQRIGEVRDVYIPTDYHSRQPKGFAFVEYATQDQASEAKNEMNKFCIKGRPLEVLFAQEKRKTPVEMKGRSGTEEEECGERGRSSSFERHREMERERRGMGARPHR